MFSDGLILVAFLLPAFVTRSLAATNCKEEDYQECLETLQSVAEEKGLIIAHNEKELITACASLNKALDCANDYAKRCLVNGTKHEDHEYYVYGPENLVKSLCTKEDNPFKTTYLKHSAMCYQNVSSELEKCDNHNFADNFDDYAQEHKVLTGCCIFFTYRVCIRDKVLAECSVSAADFIEKILLTTGGPKMNVQCTGFSAFDCFGIKPTRETSPASKSSSSYSLVVLSLFVLLLPQRRVLPSLSFY